MQSKGALKWLDRLNHPRTLQSLLLEVYGEASFYACLFESTVADMLNYHGLLDGSFKEFSTDSSTLHKMLKVVEHRRIFTEENTAELFLAKEARNKLVHRTIANKMLASEVDQEMLLAEIDEEFSKVFRGYKIVSFGLEELASQLGVSREKIAAEAERIKKEAAAEDSDISTLLTDEPRNG